VSTGIKWAVVECVPHGNRFTVLFKNLRFGLTKGCLKNSQCTADKQKLREQEHGPFRRRKRLEKVSAIVLPPPPVPAPAAVPQAPPQVTPKIDTAAERAAWERIRRLCMNPTSDEIEAADRTGNFPHLNPRWLDFEFFYKDMGPANGRKITLKDPDGEYGPGNCGWK
jgi:hypothetical protein